MDEQPQALRLAYVIEGGWDREHGQKAAAELRRLHIIEEAAKNLVKVKGRYHTEKAYNTLKELLK